MKNLILALLFCPVFLFGQIDCLKYSFDDLIKMDSQIIFYTADDNLELDYDAGEITISNKIWYRPNIEKEITKIDIQKDTLYIYEKWEDFDPLFPSGTGCLVLGCQDSHKRQYKHRLVYAVQDGEIVFVRREHGQLIEKEVEKVITETVKEWRY